MALIFRNELIYDRKNNVIKIVFDCKLLDAYHLHYGSRTLYIRRNEITFKDNDADRNS